MKGCLPPDVILSGKLVRQPKETAIRTDASVTQMGLDIHRKFSKVTAREGLERSDQRSAGQRRPLRPAILAHKGRQRHGSLERQPDSIPETIGSASGGASEKGFERVCQIKRQSRPPRGPIHSMMPGRPASFSRKSLFMASSSALKSPSRPLAQDCDSRILKAIA